MSFFITKNSSNVKTVSDLTDIEVTNPQDGQVLEYDSGSGVFQNSNPSSPVNYPVFDPDYPPVNPSAYDDNFFMDQSFDTTKWPTIVDTENSGAAATLVQNRGLKLTASNWAQIWKFLPQQVSNIGANFDVVGCFSVQAATNSGSLVASGGVFASDGATSTSNYILSGYRADPGFSKFVLQGGLPSGNPPNSPNGVQDYGNLPDLDYYVRLHWTSATKTARGFFSVNGVNWRQFYNSANVPNIGSISHVGICFQHNKIDNDFVMCKWFKFFDHGSSDFDRTLNVGRLLTP